MQNLIYVLLRRLRVPLVVLILVYTVSISGFVLIPGMDDQGRPWRMDFFHAFYFVSFMGSTIGFGEIPYPFTAAQRLWTTATIYATVIAWLFAIGTTLAVVGEPAFRVLARRTRFRRTVERLNERFFLICGYGDTGGMLVRALADAGIQSVVVDIDEDRINELELEDLGLYVPGFRGDAADPALLELAGLRHPLCAGIVALTNSDHVNLTTAITSTLLTPGLRTIARAETPAGEENIRSLGELDVINPFETFASRLAMALQAPGMYLLFEWLTGVPHEALRQPLYPPRGQWVLCGYGRFGKAVYRRMRAEGVSVRVIEADPARTDPPPDSVHGLGADAATLRAAGVEDAVGIVAGTDDDADNLSILITARELNGRLFTVGRQNLSNSAALFRAARLDLVMQRGSVIAHKIFALITTPLLDPFLQLARRQSNDWANELVSRIGGIIEDEPPQTWMLPVTRLDAPAIYVLQEQGIEVRLADLCRHPRRREQRLPCIVLLLQRQGESLLLPDDAAAVQPGDRILFCGRGGTATEMEWSGLNSDVLRYLCTGEEHPSTLLGRLLANAR